MENKEVEQALCSLDEDQSTTSFQEREDAFCMIFKYIEQLEKENAEALMVCNCISVNHKHLINLRKENAELKQQLQAKDKALDKACEELTKYNTYEFDDFQTKEDWKEWLENEID